MAVHITKQLLAVAVVAMMACSFASAQQPQQPSERYAPVPPAVHVPPTNSEQLQLQEVRQQLAEQGHYPDSASRRYMTSSRRIEAYEQHQPVQQQQGMIQQTSYVQELPGVAPATQTPATQLPPAPAQNAFQPGAFQQQPLPPAGSGSFPNTGAGQFQGGSMLAPTTGAPEAVETQDMVEARPLQSGGSLTPMQPAADAPQHELMQAQSVPTQIEAPINEIRQATTQNYISATDQTSPVQATQFEQVSTSVPARPVAPESNQNLPSARLMLSAPSIEVQSFGPQSIGINKVSEFQVVVHNTGAVVAEEIIVGIDLPEWVEIADLNLTNGKKQVNEDAAQPRLIWTVDHIGSGQQQSLTIDCIPRKAEMFDMGIEWTFAPRTGSSNVMVTEPRLEMNISGPQEVQFGEKAIYHVAVRNPGTGTAENVNVMLPAELGGERAPLGDIPAGQERNFQVELLARTAGQLILAANATADTELATSAQREIIVRRGNLEVFIEGPAMKFSGGVGRYQINIKNTGDAIATDVYAAIALPPGVSYLGGADSANEIDGGLTWPVGSLAAGDQRTYTINCQLDAAGNLQLEAGARGGGDLAASAVCVTTVETVADLVLTVADPKGPLPTGENVEYEISVTNRGTRSAEDVRLVMQFSDGIEPNNATGLQHRLVPGQVLFAPIEEISPGEQMTFQVTAQAEKAGTHIFRAQLTCSESDAREIAEGTTRFFGDEVNIPVPQNTDETADNSATGGEINR
ncbi:MAG: hypothetical protein AAF456_19060 [Planctomycetota bacterium]